ncbi:putative mitochondrial protein [Tanacetum coccineum]
MAFEQIREAMVTAQVLRMPNFSKEFTTETDTSGVGLGAILLQEGHPIAFLSKTLSSKHQLMSTYEKEFLAIVQAWDKWRGNLLDRNFKIKTDHYSLKYLLDQRMSTHAQLKWLPKFMGFDYEIRYKKRVENVTVDALSMIHHSNSCKMPTLENEFTPGPISNLEGKAGECKVEVVDITLIAREEAMGIMKFHLQRAQDRMKSQADKGRKYRQFANYRGTMTNVGDLPILNNEGVIAVEPITILERRLAKKVDERMSRLERALEGLSSQVASWVFRCEHFFNLDQVTDEEMGLVSWEVYKQAVLARFSNIFDDLMSELKNLKYKTSAKEYEDAFDDLLSKVEINEDHAISLLMGGLLTKIAMGVLVLLGTERYVIGGCDIVLGIQWLATLGDIKCSFKDLRMEFKYNGKGVALRGTQKTNVEWMGAKATNKALKKLD